MEVPSLRILMIHGYTQTSGSFYAKTGALRKALKEYNAEYCYVEGPYDAPSTDGVGQGNYGY